VLILTDWPGDGKMRLSSQSLALKGEA